MSNTRRIRMMVALGAVVLTAPAVAAPKPAVPAPKKANKKVKVVDLVPFRADYTVAPGTQLMWNYESHGSVGKTGSCSGSPAAVVKFVEKKVKYRYPEKLKRGMSGADEGVGTYVFEATGQGAGTITCEVGFRGKVTRTDTFTIKVKAKSKRKTK